jgi:predicted RNA methylase
MKRHSAAPMNCTRRLRHLLLLPTLGFVLAFAQEKKLREPDVPYEPSPENVVEQMLKLADVHEGDIVYDLGCGDGRMVITAARQFGARGVGIDIDPQRIKESLENAKQQGCWIGSPSAMKTFSRRISRKQR